MKRKPRLSENRAIAPTAPAPMPKKIEQIDSYLRIQFNVGSVWLDPKKARICDICGFDTKADVIESMRTASRQLTKSEVKQILKELEFQMMRYAVGD